MNILINNCEENENGIKKKIEIDNVTSAYRKE